MTDDRVTLPLEGLSPRGKTKVMTLDADEFIRRFLLHVLPDGFHRIRHYGFLANGHRATKLALCRRLLAIPRQNALDPMPKAPLSPPRIAAPVAEDR